MQVDFADEYEDFEHWHWCFRGRQRILAELILRQWHAAGCSELPRSLVSVGSGPPQGFAWLRSLVSPGGVLLGLDADPSGALRARASAKGISFLVEDSSFVVGALGSPPLRSKAFDVVVALDVIEHLDDDVGALRRAADLVSPRGLMAVSVPACPSLWGDQDEVSQHRRRYTSRSLRKAFVNADLGEPQVTYFNTLLFPAVAVVRWGRRLLRLAPRGRSDFEMGRPGRVNDALAELFGWESRLIGRVPLPIGVSLAAVWRPSR